jgi:hypothetical protein
MALSRQEVAEHLKAPGVVNWVRLARLLHDRPLSCVDGRDEHAVLGTPGGHAGEYIVLLTVIEAITGAEMTMERLNYSFDRFLDSFGAFYMHTDSTALENLAKALAEDPAFKDVGTDPADVEALVRNPGDRAEALLPLLVRPDHVGCGHLKLQLLHPHQYGVRKALVELVIQLVFCKMWAGAAIDYVVLKGGHAEGAVVQITTGRTKHPYTRVPMVAPRHGDQQIFVAHPKVVDWLRHQLALYVAEEVPELRGADPDVFAADVNALANKQLVATLGHLAKGLPVYNARVTHEGVVQVSE